MQKQYCSEFYPTPGLAPPALLTEEHVGGVAVDVVELQQAEAAAPNLQVLTVQHRQVTRRELQVLIK